MKKLVMFGALALSMLSLTAVAEDASRSVSVSKPATRHSR